MNGDRVNYINRRQGRVRFAFRGTVGLAVAGLVALLAAGCSQGSYPLDFFYEMHYSQAYKASEPPRMSPPESAVPWFPPPQRTSNASGAHLYATDCAMCHGAQGKGDGAVLQTMITKYNYQPLVTPDLTSAQVTGMGGPGIQGFMRSGVVVMPNFSKLLSGEEIQAISEYIVNCLQGAQPQQCR